MSMAVIDKAYFPGFARKAISFSIDDGNLAMDEKFINIVKPRGIFGTFNLTAPKLDVLSASGYRDFYRGYEIANHCKYHPVTIDPLDTREFSDRIFERDTADERYYYRHPEVDGLWYLKRHDFWCVGAKYEDYIRFADCGRAELEAVFGKGAIKGFVWPHGCCYDERIFEHLRAEGYLYTRYTKHVDGEFAVQKDRMRIGMHARSTNLPKAAEDFVNAPDTGELKMLIFGVHSNDYERDGKWGVLADFCDVFREKPSEYYSAPIAELFEYEDAKEALSVTEDKLKNPSDRTLYVKIDGEKTVIPPHAELSL